uniref:(northern house mosquito) hypothetical protein n=1 Tax=Culex pipiens TaxID=7175 RepID=A0A8D8J6X4_CULPI
MPSAEDREHRRQPGSSNDIFHTFEAASFEPACSAQNGSPTRDADVVQVLPRAATAVVSFDSNQLSGCLFLPDSEKDAHAGRAGTAGSIPFRVEQFQQHWRCFSDL